jgi:hypothetical protein
VRKLLSISVVILGALLLAACSLNPGDLGAAVPTTGNTASDPSAVQQFLPNLPGYTRTSASSIAQAVTAVGGSASLITGNPVTAALIAQIDGMIQCYERVGAVSAQIYTESDLGQVLQGEIPTVGALALVNQSRVVNNFLPCALGAMGESFSAQAVEPCSGSGQFVANNETILYLYAATNPELCAAFQSALPG